MTQLDIFDHIGGKTFDLELDGERLGEQMKRVLSLMKDGQWRSLREIEDKTDDPQASISARLRDVRKLWGDQAMKTRRRPSVDARRGVFEYRVILPDDFKMGRAA